MSFAPVNKDCASATVRLRRDDDKLRYYFEADEGGYATSAVLTRQ